MILSRRKPHFVSKSERSLEKDFCLTTRLGTYRNQFSSKNRTQGEISVSKLGFMLKDLKNQSKSIERFRKKNEDSGCLKNEHFFADLFFFLLTFWVPLGSYGFSGLLEIDFQKKTSIFTEEKIHKSKNCSRKLST